MTISRRALLASLAAVTAAGPTRLVRAQSWRGQYPELVYAVVPAENATGVLDRYTPFVEYLGRELGSKVTLRVANDYAAVIEGQRAGNIHIGYYGPASFSRARLTGVPTDAFVIDVNSDGSKGYYSVFYVPAKSPYQKIEDLKGKNLGLVDPNSTSGYNTCRSTRSTRLASAPTRSLPRRKSPAATRMRYWHCRKELSMSAPIGGTPTTTRT
jgi:phosphonate transport system substrate-binding protein